MQLLLALSLALFIAGIGGSWLRHDGDWAPQSDSATTAPAPDSRFVAVSGRSFDDRRTAAIERGRKATDASHFWVAYGFDVRPGVAIDLEIRNVDGGVTRIEGTSIQTNGKVETRNLGVFMLFERSSSAPDRVEIYNLDRQHAYESYPVYWIGHATADESFATMQSLLDNQPSAWVAERAVVAIAVNADSRAGDLLVGIVTSSRIDRARTTAVMWLGIVGERLPFLAGLVRDEREGVELRKQAAMAIGISKNPASVPTLRGLFDSVTTHDVRDHIVVAVGVHSEESGASDDEAVDFLIRVADIERDESLKRQAIFWLSQKAGKRSLDALVARATSASPGDVELQKQAVFALSQRPKDEAVPILMRLAKTHSNPEVRKSAIFWLGQIDDDRVLPFFKELLAK